MRAVDYLRRGPWSSEERAVAVRCDEAGVQPRDAVAFILRDRGVSLRVAAMMLGVPVRRAGLVRQMSERAAVALCAAAGDYDVMERAREDAQDLLDCMEQPGQRRDHGPPMYLDSYGRAREWAPSPQIVTADDIAHRTVLARARRVAHKQP